MGVKVREHPPKSGIYYIKIDHNGKRKSKKIGRDKREANRIAKRLEAKLAAGDLRIDKPKTPTFKQYAEEWLKSPQNWKESTREGHAINVRNHAYPRIGHLPLDQIGKREVRTMLDDLLKRGGKKKKGLAPKTVKCIQSVVSGVLDAAAEDDLIERNIVQDVKAKGGNGKKKVEPKPLMAVEAIALLEKAEGTPYHPIILCALTTGLRLGEIEELRWKDVDLEERVIEVKRSHRKNRVTDTKNHHNRRVDVPQHLAQVLRELKVQCKEELWKKEIEEELVFKRFPRSTLGGSYHQLLKDANLKRRRFHDLRHSYATLRLLKGDNIIDVSKQLGHSSIEITVDTYGHWVPGTFKSEVDELGDMLQKHATYPQPKTESGGAI